MLASLKFELIMIINIINTSVINMNNWKIQSAVPRNIWYSQTSFQSMRKTEIYF
jgi:hypothetical protein